MVAGLQAGDAFTHFHHHTAPSWPSTAEYAFRIVTGQGKRIGMANAGVGNFDQHFAFLRRSNINFNDFQRLAGPNATAARDFMMSFPCCEVCGFILDKSAVNGRLPPSAQPADPGWSPRHQLIFEVNFNHFPIRPRTAAICCKMARQDRPIPWRVQGHQPAPNAADAGQNTFLSSGECGIRPPDTIGVLYPSWEVNVNIKFYEGIRYHVIYSVFLFLTRTSELSYDTFCKT